MMTTPKRGRGRPPVWSTVDREQLLEELPTWFQDLFPKCRRGHPLVILGLGPRDEPFVIVKSQNGGYHHDQVAGSTVSCRACHQATARKNARRARRKK